MKLISVIMVHMHKRVRPDLMLDLICIDDVTCDVMPGSMCMHHSNIHCSFARQFAHALRWSGHVLLKLPPHYTSPVVSHRVVQ